MAIEDALVLATLLAEYWEKPDGHVEAFYLYEVIFLEYRMSIRLVDAINSVPLRCVKPCTPTRYGTFVVFTLLKFVGHKHIITCS